MRGTERERYLAWENLSNHSRHMILMYLYRVETMPMEEIESYIETYYFRQLGIKRDDLPMAITALRGVALKRAAYHVINKELDEIKEPA